jgi:hypothetical protein
MEVASSMNAGQYLHFGIPCNIFHHLYVGYHGNKLIDKRAQFSRSYQIFGFALWPVKFLDISVVVYNFFSYVLHSFPIRSEKGSCPCDRPCRPLRLWDVEAFTDVDEVSLRPPFTPRKICGLITVRVSVDPRAIMRLEGLNQLKNSMTSLEM